MCLHVLALFTESFCARFHKFYQQHFFHMSVSTTLDIYIYIYIYTIDVGKNFTLNENAQVCLWTCFWFLLKFLFLNKLLNKKQNSKRI